MDGFEDASLGMSSGASPMPQASQEMVDAATQMLRSVRPFGGARGVMGDDCGAAPSPAPPACASARRGVCECLESGDEERDECASEPCLPDRPTVLLTAPRAGDLPVEPIDGPTGGQIQRHWATCWKQQLNV